MRLLFMGLLPVFPIVLLYEQHRFTVKFERAELVHFNASFFNFVKLTSYKYNRTQACLNVTLSFKVAVENELKTEIQAYRFASNEYRDFPLRFMFDFCTTANKNDFGLGKIFKCGNMTGCPLKKATYDVCQWFPDGSRFPPNIPAGSYMLDAKLFYRSVEAMFYRIYAVIDYPVLY